MLAADTEAAARIPKTKAMRTPSMSIEKGFTKIYAAAMSRAPIAAPREKAWRARDESILPPACHAGMISRRQRTARYAMRGGIAKRAVADTSSGIFITGSLTDPGCQGPGPWVSRRLKGSQQIAHRGHSGFLSVLLEDSALLSGQGRHGQAVAYSVLDLFAMLRNRLRSRCAGRGALLFEPVLDRLGHYHGLGGVVVDAVLGDALLQGFRDEERDLDFQLGLGMVLFV